MVDAEQLGERRANQDRISSAGACRSQFVMYFAVACTSAETLTNAVGIPTTTAEAILDKLEDGTAVVLVDALAPLVYAHKPHQ
jgi:hypothetical protein